MKRIKNTPLPAFKRPPALADRQKGALEISVDFRIYTYIYKFQHRIALRYLRFPVLSPTIMVPLSLIAPRAIPWSALQVPDLPASAASAYSVP